MPHNFEDDFQDAIDNAVPCVRLAELIMDDPPIQPRSRYFGKSPAPAVASHAPDKTHLVLQSLDRLSAAVLASNAAVVASNREMRNTMLKAFAAGLAIVAVLVVVLR